MKCVVKKTANGFSIEVAQEAGLREGEAEAVLDERKCVVIIERESKGNAGGARVAEGQGGAGNASAGVNAAVGADGAEARLLAKLSLIKFDQRIPGEVDKGLDAQELAALAGLIKKKIVTIYYGKKYSKSGVYSIASNAFLHGNASVDGSKANAVAPASKYQNQASAPASTEEAALQKAGYLVLENEAEARRVSGLLGDKVTKGEVVGVRGFDRKYYLATKEFYASNEAAAISALSKPKNAADFSREAKLAVEAANVMLALLCERGEAIEKRRGMFEAV